MKALKEIQQKLKEIEELKVIAKKDIINDNNISKIEKLTLLTDNRMLGVYDYLPNIFAKWEKDCRELERQSAIDDGKDPEKDYICKYTDDIFCNDNYRRHETVNLVELLRNLSYDYKDFDNDTMVVVTSRGDYHTKITKTINEVIDVMYDWCVKNDSYGFEMDW